MENTLTFIALGAYAFLCLDIVLRMSIRILNYEDYSYWQRHLYGCWGAQMAFVFVQLVWDAIVLHFNLSWEMPLNMFMRNIALLCIQLCGLMLLTLVTHRVITARLMACHIIPFLVLTVTITILQYFEPDVQFDIILYVAEGIYSIATFIFLIKKMKEYNYKLQQTYSNSHRRSLNWVINLVWMFGIVFLLYIYFRWINLYLDVFFYPIATSAWYYINWHIINMRDIEELISTDEIEIEKEVEYSQEDIDQNSNTQRLSLRELTKKRLEDTLEEVCLSKRLYLNPDLTVNDLANELNTNRTYVSQYFSERHTTFLKYINDLRVEYAMYQLVNTSHKIQDIMIDSGFHHMETFKRAFFNRYNCDPREVKRKDSN